MVPIVAQSSSSCNAISSLFCMNAIFHLPPLDACRRDIVCRTFVLTLSQCDLGQLPCATCQPSRLTLRHTPYAGKRCEDRLSIRKPSSLHRIGPVFHVPRSSPYAAKYRKNHVCKMFDACVLFRCPFWEDYFCLHRLKQITWCFFFWILH
jgi:hypothetical protein